MVHLNKHIIQYIEYTVYIIYVTHIRLQYVALYSLWKSLHRMSRHPVKNRYTYSPGNSMQTSSNQLAISSTSLWIAFHLPKEKHTGNPLLQTHYCSRLPRALVYLL